MLKEVLIFIISCIVLVKSAEYAVKSATRIARHFKLTEFVTSFIIIAFIAALPEGFISIIAALKGDPGLGLGTLFGSNIADLTIVLGLIALAGHPLKIHSSIVKKDLFFILLVLLPVILGMNGILSRLDGIILISAGLIFIFVLLKERQYFNKPVEKQDHALKNFFILVASLILMTLSANFIVQSTHSIAIGLGISSLVIGLVLVGLGTTLPEFTFALQSVRKGHEELAVGDILGTVVVDACILIGIIALIHPIIINVFILSVVGVFMLFSVIFSLYFMRTDSLLSKNEALTLIFFYIAFVVAQILLR